MRKDSDLSRNKTDRQLIELLTHSLANRLLQIGLLLAGFLLVWKNLHATLKFDDAFMFYRYAIHMREGLGISWNLDKVHTLGLSSPMWCAIVWAASFLPLAPGQVLVLASSFSTFGAVLAIAVAIVLNAKSPILKSVTRVTFLIVLPPLCLSGMFLANSRSGMETMFAVAINGIICGAVWIWSREPSKTHAWIVGLASLAAFLTRPESALPSLIVIALAALLLSREQLHFIDAFLPICILCVGISIYIIACKLYFHDALPLAFYVKRHQFYLGYIGQKRPVLRALQFFAACSASLFLLVWLTTLKQLRILVVFLIPLLAVTLYLCTIVQIMGSNSRYYLPYCPYIFFPAMMVLDESLAVGEGFRVNDPLLRLCMSVFLFSVIGSVLPDKVFQKLDDFAEGRRVRYAEAQRVEEAKAPLPPVEWDQGWMTITDLIIAKLPKGATVAATEVGYMGAMAPQVNIIDLSGLNNPQIALNGFSMETMLKQKPDLVWLPFPDYTYYRGVFFDSTEFLSQYTVFDGALTYGIALRKDSPFYAQMMAGMQHIWAKEYGGTRMEDYEVQSAHWDRTPIPL